MIVYFLFTFWLTLLNVSCIMCLYVWIRAVCVCRCCCSVKGTRGLSSCVGSLDYPIHSCFINFNMLKINQFCSYKLVDLSRCTVISNNTVLLSIIKLNKPLYPYHTGHPETWAVPNRKPSYGNQSSLYNLPEILNQLSNTDIIVESSTKNRAPENIDKYAIVSYKF